MAFYGLLIRRSLVRAQVEEPKTRNESSPYEKSLGLFLRLDGSVRKHWALHGFGGYRRGTVEWRQSVARPLVVMT